MDRNTAAIIVISTLLIWLIYDLIKSRIIKKELKQANKDLNIEFGSSDGNGIELVKKQYPDLEIKDDHRTGLKDANKS